MFRYFSLIFGLISVLFVISCTNVATYHRTGLVPVPQPALRDGGPMKNQITLFTGSGLLSVQKPVETVSDVTVNTSDGSEVYTFTQGEGNYVSKAQPMFGLRWKFDDNLDLGIMGEYAPGFMKIKTFKESFDLVPQGDAYGFGFSAMYSMNFELNFNIGVGADVMIYSIPYAKVAITQNDDGAWVSSGSPVFNREAVLVGSFYLIPHWKFPWGALFAGLTLRNHPTVPKISQEENDPLGDIILTILFPPYIFMSNDNVLSGNMYTVFSAGFSYELTEYAKIIASVYMPVTREPVYYYPSFMLGFEWGL